jgi:hypothetical protein
MGKKSRDKGVRLEKEFVRLLKESEVFPEAERNWSQQMEETSGKDVKGTPGFIFQCKGGKQPRWKDALGEALQEAVQQLDEDRKRSPQNHDWQTPVGATKEDRQPWVVHLFLDDFLQLLWEWSHGGPQ